MHNIGENQFLNIKPHLQTTQHQYHSHTKMPPRVNLPFARRALTTTQKTPIPLRPRANPLVSLESRRHNSSGSKDPNSKAADSDNASKGLGPTQDPLPHVSEEAAQMEKIMKGGGIMGKEKRCDGVVEAESPELEQGTPVSEVCYRISCFSCWSLIGLEGWIGLDWIGLKWDLKY